MSITLYAQTHRSKSKAPKADIIERWNTRVVPQSLHTAGRRGASDYLARYGKSIAAPKVVALAICAEAHNAVEMAAGFWEQAYLLETGKSESYSSDGEEASAAPVNVPTSRKAESVQIPGLPAEFQPGFIHTMQPTDAPRPQSSYIVDPEYCGQPKRDGNRNEVFGSPTVVAHQSRSTSVIPSFSAEFDEAAKKAAADIGAFVADGEKTYLSVNGDEFLTASEAAQENVNLGRGSESPVVLYSVFKALYLNGSLLDATEKQRVDAGVKVVQAINRHLEGRDNADVIVEATPTAYTTAEKQALVDDQKKNGREGEVWTRINCKYTGGKGHKTDTVRTKDTILVDALIIGVNRSTANGRSVASFEISDLDGKPIGHVGSPNEQSARELLAKHEAAPGTVRIKVRCQKITVYGKLRHARFD